ncbi:NLR family CARD domain-containing protein 4-like [Glandiceps talaboti]
MTNLCSHLSERERKEINTNPHFLIKKLIKNDFISEENTTYLENLLQQIGLRVLAKNVQKRSSFINDPDRPWCEPYKLPDQLKIKYRALYKKFAPIPWNPDHCVAFSEMYVPGVLSVKENYLRDPLPYTNKKDIFDRLQQRDKDCTRVVVLGSPGAGKSMFCQKLAYSWAKGELPAFKLVILLQMKDLDGSLLDYAVDTIASLDINIHPSHFRDFIRENGKKVLFLLDGIDEVKSIAWSKSDVVDVISKKALSTCMVLSTMRPHQADIDLSNNMMIEITSFDEDATKRLINNYLYKDQREFGDIRVETFTTKIKEYMKGRDAELMSYPLHVSFLCTMWLDHEYSRKLHEGEFSFPSNIAELYTEVLQCILRRYCTKNKIDMKDGIVPKHTEALVESIAKAANKALIDGKQRFEVDSIPVEAQPLGLLVKDYGFPLVNPKRRCFFYHGLWMYYFVAYYICKCTKDNTSRRERIEEIESLDKFHEVEIFLSEMLPKWRDLLQPGYADRRQMYNIV